MEKLTHEEFACLEQVLTHRLIDLYNNRDRFDAELKRIRSGWYGRADRAIDSKYGKEKEAAYKRNEDRIEMVLSIKQKLHGE